MTAAGGLSAVRQKDWKHRFGWIWLTPRSCHTGEMKGAESHFLCCVTYQLAWPTMMQLSLAVQWFSQELLCSCCPPYLCICPESAVAFKGQKGGQITPEQDLPAVVSFLSWVLGTKSSPLLEQPWTCWPTRKLRGEKVAAVGPDWPVSLSGYLAFWIFLHKAWGCVAISALWWKPLKSNSRIEEERWREGEKGLRWGLRQSPLRS